MDWTVVNLTASFTSSTTLGSISNNVLTIPNNESTNAKSETLTVIFTLENKQTKEVSAALNQAAGAKVYTDWVLDLQTDGTSVEAKGGTRTVTANIARRLINGITLVLFIVKLLLLLLVLVVVLVLVEIK